MAKLKGLERKISARDLPVLMRKALELKEPKPCGHYRKGDNTERWFFSYYTSGGSIDTDLENSFRNILIKYFGKPRIYNFRGKPPRYIERALKIINNGGGVFVASGQELFSKRVNKKTIDIASGCGASYNVIRIHDLGRLEADFYSI